MLFQGVSNPIFFFGFNVVVGTALVDSVIGESFTTSFPLNAVSGARHVITIIKESKMRIKFCKFNNCLRLSLFKPLKNEILISCYRATEKV